MSTSTAGLDAPSTTLNGTFVLLRADTLRLLLPQQDVGSADYIERAPQTTHRPGIFAHGEGDSAQMVMALSTKMRPLAVFPSDRFLLTRLATSFGDVALAWNEVRVLMAGEFKSQPLPPAMRAPGAPIDSYVELDGELEPHRLSRRPVGLSQTGVV